MTANHVNSHFYADGSQMYLSFSQRSQSEALEVCEKLTACVEKLQSWMSQNLLKLNTDKTEVLVFKPPSLHTPVSISSMNIGSSDITPAQSVQNLGCMFHDTASMSTHVQAVCKAAWFHLWNLSAIRPMLTRDATERLVHAFISSKLDSCNSLLINIPAKEFQEAATGSERSSTSCSEEAEEPLCHRTPAQIALAANQKEDRLQGRLRRLQVPNWHRSWLPL